MKRLIALTLLASPFILQAQDNFTVKGRVGKASAPGKVYLLYRDEEKIVTDSVVLNKGSFIFKGHVTEPTPARIIVDHAGVGYAATKSTADMSMLYLEPGTIEIKAKDSVKKAVFTSPLNAAFAKY